MGTRVEDLHLVTYPADVLRTKAKPVPAVTEEVRNVAERMLELMREHEGIGLAAPQVGLAWRMFIVDVPPSDKRQAEKVDSPYPTHTDGPEVYINPRFEKMGGELATMEEGCLSIPDIRGDVLRPPTVTITATDLSGEEFTQTATGLLARCWQHEMDHLDGVLIIDKFTQLSRIKNAAAIKDLKGESKGKKK